MYVTDTPVIDRLVNPGPLDILHEFEAAMVERVSNRERNLIVDIQLLLDDCEEDDDARPANLAAAYEIDRQIAVVREFAGELATRLAAIS